MAVCEVSSDLILLALRLGGLDPGAKASDGPEVVLSSPGRERKPS